MKRQYYEDPHRDYRNRGYRGEGYFGQSYAGSYPNMPYGTTNTSRFERGFNFDLLRERGGRGWWPKTRDEVARWFGDEEAERRRQRDEHREAMSGNRGKGPRNYQRPDDRIKDEVSDLLWDSDEVDASDMDVEVGNGEVTLTGTVPSRYQKRRAADIAECVWGVTDVMNLIRIEKGELTSDTEKMDLPPQSSIDNRDTEKSTSVVSGG